MNLRSTVMASFGDGFPRGIRTPYCGGKEL
jgi:hypothetical protein